MKSYYAAWNAFQALLISDRTLSLDHLLPRGGGFAWEPPQLIWELFFFNSLEQFPNTVTHTGLLEKLPLTPDPGWGTPQCALLSKDKSGSGWRQDESGLTVSNEARDGFCPLAFSKSICTAGIPG